MDDNRDQHWQSLLFVISVIVFGTGIYFYFKNRYDRHPASISQEALKDVENQLKKQKQAVDPARSSAMSESTHPPEQSEQASEKSEAHTSSNPDSFEQPTSTGTMHEKAPPVSSIEKELKHIPVCQSLQGLRYSAFSLQPHLWKKAQALFRTSQKQLISSLSHPITGLTRQALTILKKQILQIKLGSPPWQDGPHLKRQAIGLWVRGNPSSTLHLGESFFILLESDPQRAEFEISRWVAQSIAPCELPSIEARKIWSPFLKCLGIPETCGNHLYSETGWATSSSTAWVLSPPSCQLPAFKNPHALQCLAQLPFKKLNLTQEANP